MELLKDYFLQQLFNAKATEDCMKSLALYIRTFKEDYSTVVEGLDFAYKKSSMHHKIVLLYLINEILQTEKSSSGVPLRNELNKFLRSHFLKDRDLSINNLLVHKRFIELQNIWKSRGLIDFEDNYSIEEIISNVYENYNDKSKLIIYLESVCDYYKHKGY